MASGDRQKRQLQECVSAITTYSIVASLVPTRISVPKAGSREHIRPTMLATSRHECQDVFKNVSKSDKTLYILCKGTDTDMVSESMRNPKYSLH